jgi:kynurenine formamidase
MKEADIIDLSYPVTSEMLVFPGTERPAFQWLGRLNSEGYNLTKFTMLTHTGTHADAPCHFVDNVPSIDEIPLNRFFGRAKLFRYKKGLRGQEITLEDVVSSGFELDENILFVLATGIAEFAEKEAYNRIYPVPSEELIGYLIRKRIRCYMTDATSIDLAESENSPNHHQLLGAEIPIVENLRNLHLLPENKPFLISALPLMLTGREGAPCRAVAIPEMEGLAYK